MRVVALVLALSLAATACGDGEDRAALEAEVLAAYRAHWDAFLTAADPPNPDHPALAATTTGRELEFLRNALARDREAGVVVRGSINLDPEVVRVNDGEAWVRDCIWDRSGVFVRETGQVAVPVTTEMELRTFRLVRTEGRWKVAERRKHEGPCERRR